MILLTGATGFIGSSIVKKLNGHVRCVVRDKSRALSVGREVFYIESLSSNTNWLGAFVDVEAVIHLGGRAHILKDYSCDPLGQFRQTNTAATLTLARNAASHGVKRFVFVSSIGVNGSSNTRPFKETDPPCPVGNYAISKFEAEEGLRKIAQETDMEVVIIRPPMVYGPEAPGNFSSLLRLVCNGIPLPFGSVHNKRSLIALENLTDFILHCTWHPKAGNETFLIADDQDVSISELIRFIAFATHRPCRIFPFPVLFLKMGAILIGRGAASAKLLGSLQVDISKAKKVLGWMPPITMREQFLLIERQIKN